MPLNRGLYLISPALYLPSIIANCRSFKGVMYKVWPPNAAYVTDGLIMDPNTAYSKVCGYLCGEDRNLEVEEV